jgi:uncharacterized repeat protein (TIGR03803 family)
MFALTTLLTAASAAAQTETVLYGFNITDGENPYAGLVFGSNGNLYGATANGGTYSYGTVFELSPAAGGGWTEKVLHNFGHGKDGSFPIGNLIFGKVGHLYGTTEYGGTGPCKVILSGCGTVFELAEAGGVWTEKVLYDFQNDEAGGCPSAGLIFDHAGNLYGTTSANICANAGVFELSRATGGGWTEKVLYSLSGIGSVAGMIFDSAGHLYGTTVDGGTYGYGTVFELSPEAGGGWTERVLHSFNNNGRDGEFPQAGLIFDAAGNLYSTTLYGGDGTFCGGDGCGIVFELTRNAGGGWTEKVLHSFTNDGTDGHNPYAGLALDAAGNLYGTTSGGGAYGGGTVFELSPTTGGGWTETIAYSFNTNGVDGQGPLAGLIFDAAGNLYGTTIYGGGVYNEGSVFEITP